MRNILVAVVGITPQIITETAYALCTRSKPVRLDKLYIVTTSVGKEKVQKSLVRQGILQKLADEYKLKPLSIDEDSFVIIKDPDGNEIADITDNIESEAAGELIAALIRDLTKDPANVLHCSIAGGRKTMGFYLGAALQLFGRPQDRLYHVLVTPEFESNPNFFYPPKKQVVIESKKPDGTVVRLNTKNARVRLAELPFIRLRNMLPPDDRGFKELVRKGQEQVNTALVQPELVLDLTGRTIIVGNHTIQMPPFLMAFYAVLLQAKGKNCVEPQRLTCGGCSGCYIEISRLSSKEFVTDMGYFLKRIFPNRSGKADDFAAKWKDGIHQETIRQYITKVNNELKRQAAGQQFISFCIISGNKRWGSSTYGVTLERDNVKIV